MEETYCERFMVEQLYHTIPKPNTFVSLMEEIGIRYWEQPMKIIFYRMSPTISWFWINMKHPFLLSRDSYKN